MNKKISVLDLANMKEDEMPRKIKYRDSIYDYQENEKKYKKEDSEAEVWLDWETEVEILEDNTEDIEELDKFDIQGLEVSGYLMTQAEYLLEDGIEENRQKINELVRKINCIERKMNEN